MFRKLLSILLAVPAILVTLHTIIRIMRHFHKFPIPQGLANLIDNPLRRRLQPPEETAVRHGIQPGMRVLEVGPGNGTYTLAAARRIGETGELATIDIEPKMIERVRLKIQAAGGAGAGGMAPIDARVADVYDLPFEDNSFDLVYMIAVIGEIPEPLKAMGEFRRVLKPGGRLVFSELLMDPDYPLAGTLMLKASAAGFGLQRKTGNFFYYTLIFEKV